MNIPPPCVWQQSLCVEITGEVSWCETISHFQYLVIAGDILGSGTANAEKIGELSDIDWTVENYFWAK